MTARQYKGEFGGAMRRYSLVSRLFKMAPNLFGTSATLYLEASQQNIHQEKSTTEKTNNQELLVEKSSNTESSYEWKIVWRNVIAFTYLHIGAIYGLYLAFTSAKYQTTIWLLSLIALGGMGVTAGAHRLWAHRTYKAKWPMRFLLMILQTIAFQNHIYEWVRDHRVHHKFTDTNADPHNAKRGFFFSHVGWLLVRKHPDVLKKGATVDMSDLENDPIVVWQRRLYLLLVPTLCFVLPVWVPCYLWKETLFNSWYSTLTRYTLSLNGTWLVNSAAHIWGAKPYDKNIGPTENKSVAIVAFGEGWHNYHHVFPWDYKAAELGDYKVNITTAFIDFCARLGLAYDMKTVPVEAIKRRAIRTGDGTKYNEHDDSHHHMHVDMKWGWGDADMKPEEIQEVEIINKSN
ncbi:acyl-CoA Delta-9 desaturase isoform X1 [Bombus vancouverensis nearcticus]|uniref:(11Z)-hexadec-11-enoyl-CoA conjugase-like isoform X1 n=2 Tax=Bombus bifarius TaxID=103933 RepID=A0A6P8N5W2_9HYME|nr:(11Z)-hexadec-11-enoyl-CoA conjugase-like isoform X1 [Bombus vancouverensis nearcticus]XP_033200610.1 (11Z)-hexadec-11-enoyl-CoA conjugase-like isoform X1 [Bombus vancouverensis nearcticus]XP_033310014.1 (11Z)-hexadec-11-enoyl-CoA conjugase-like isoform X1 [Bombus bifarius]XP_033310015.1 (11Z)-hexadec-11-enoyl-CoA conjugase-like isoform X1 [Bombus bifarius]